MTLAEIPWHPLLLSLKVASVATVLLALALGLGLALLLTRKRFAERGVAGGTLHAAAGAAAHGHWFALLHVLGRNGWVAGRCCGGLTSA